MKKVFVLFFIVGFLGAAAPLPVKGNDTITLTPDQIIILGQQLFDMRNFDDAGTLLSAYSLPDAELETERQFLLGRIAAEQGDVNGAIKAYQKILDKQPNLQRIRLELAVAYMHKKAWYRADYQTRLAASGDLPPAVQFVVQQMLFTIRQNKNWNFWISGGSSTDSNINTTAAGRECINIDIWGTGEMTKLCRDLPERDAATGIRAAAGGNYEIKLGDRWRIKSDANLSITKYRRELKEYDMLYLGAATGPRYIFQNGDVWLGATANKMWQGGENYNDSVGAKIDANYDLSKRISLWGAANFGRTAYNDYLAEILDGNTGGIMVGARYSFDASKYLTARAGFAREDTAIKAYANNTWSYAAGFGAELMRGFHAYAEASVNLAKYDDARWVVKDLAYVPIAEQDQTWRYSLSLSHNRISLFGFTPVLNYSFSHRMSNMPEKEYDRHMVDVSVQRRF